MCICRLIRRYGPTLNRESNTSSRQMTSSPGNGSSALRTCIRCVFSNVAARCSGVTKDVILTTQRIQIQSPHPYNPSCDQSARADPCKESKYNPHTRTIPTPVQSLVRSVRTRRSIQTRSRASIFTAGRATTIAIKEACYSTHRICFYCCTRSPAIPHTVTMYLPNRAEMFEALTPV